MSEIIPKKLYLGNIINVNRLQWMNQHNINTIICVASKDDVSIKKEIWDSKMVYQFEIMDDTSQTLDFEPIIHLIEESFDQGAVLVNCAAGMSRSVSFVIAYLMKMQKKTFNEAFIFVKRARPKIFPNSFFMSQLRMYEEKLGNTQYNNSSGNNILP